MGLLDDAIREHLELRRRAGADASEVARLEHEALGPVVRGETRTSEPAAPEAGADVDEQQLAIDDPFADQPPAAPLAHDEAPGEVHEPQPEEPSPADPGPALQGHDASPGAGGALEHAPAPGLPPVDQVVEHEPHAPPPAVGQPPEAGPRARAGQPTEGAQPTEDAQPTEEYDVEAVHAAATHGEPAVPHEEPAPAAAAQPGPHEPEVDAAQADAPVDKPAGREHPAGEGEPADGDVLEQTPEFLQETPEHDRLWFEQAPPKDFDFDR